MRKIATKVFKRIRKQKTSKVIAPGDYCDQKKAAEGLFDQIAMTEKTCKRDMIPCMPFIWKWSLLKACRISARPDRIIRTIQNLHPFCRTAIYRNRTGRTDLP